MSPEEKLERWLSSLVDSPLRKPDRRAYLGDDAAIDGMTWGEVKTARDYLSSFLYKQANQAISAARGKKEGE